MFNLSTAVARACSNPMWSQILSAVPRETHGKVGVSSTSFMLESYLICGKKNTKADIPPRGGIN